MARITTRRLSKMLVLAAMLSCARLATAAEPVDDWMYDEEAVSEEEMNAAQYGHEVPESEMEVESSGNLRARDLRAAAALAAPVAPSGIDGHVELPGEFRSGAVVDPEKDAQGLTINQYKYLGDILPGGSIVYTFDVATAGVYPVTYALSGAAPDGEEGEVLFSFLPGRRKCPSSGMKGRVYIDKFTTGDWNKEVIYRGMNQRMKAGNGQEYTLCFIMGGNMNVNKICLGQQCLDQPDIIPSWKLPPRAVVGAPDAGDTQCLQADTPVGAKPGSCMQVMCVPQYISIGARFHTTVRWCLQRPRQSQITFGLLSDTQKHFLADIGTGTTFMPEDEMMCGEHTFEVTYDPAVVNANDVNIWTFYSTPLLYSGADQIADIYPDELGESSIVQQPQYFAQNGAQAFRDCPIVPTRTWNLPVPANSQDGLMFAVKPQCITPGKPWSITVDTHLETLATADLRANLQRGTGPDKYLGAADEYVGEAYKFNIAKNTAQKPWTRTTLTFTAQDTFNIEAEDNSIYVVAFMVPAGEQYATKNAWTILDREYNLAGIEICPQVTPQSV